MGGAAPLCTGAPALLAPQPRLCGAGTGAGLQPRHMATTLPLTWAPLPAPSAGMRSLPLLCMSCFMPLPPLMALLMHVALVRLTWAPPAAFCATRLLRDPLWLQRQALLVDALEFLVLPLAAVHPHMAIGLYSEAKSLAVGPNSLGGCGRLPHAGHNFSGWLRASSPRLLWWGGAAEH